MIFLGAQINIMCELLFSSQSRFLNISGAMCATRGLSV
jgi:hypothetical protein